MTVIRVTIDGKRTEVTKDTENAKGNFSEIRDQMIAKVSSK